ncbi:autophagy-related protein 16-1 [Entomortierella parvispora]|uniref:Autophagy-related protein 16-1 n=1 Tax=Entomortierella parvispora TaxID=205924 RepID=A0A9P3HHM1_9FUNG|nr:autophagy-related protein 16-1 [Entomortierella parvispora]
MTMASTAQHWEADILHLFADRDKHEKAFTNMVESYNGLVQKLSYYVDQNKHLETSAQTSKEQHEKMARQYTVMKEQGSPLNQKRSAELEAQVSSLKDERAELYKTQGTNAQRLLDLNDILRVKDATLAQNKDEIRRLAEANHVLAHKNQEFTELVREKDVTIQVIQDELATLQLEMVKLDERQRDLERENAQLLQRWLKKMNEEAERMNAANVFLENEQQDASALSPPVLSPPSTRSLRSLGPESPTSANWRGNSAIFSIIPQISSRKIAAHDSEVNTVSLSNGGTMFATGSSDKKIKIWDIKTGSLKSTLTGCLQSVMCVSFNATDELLLGASNDNAARLWHLGTGRPRHTLTGHIGKVFSARFNPDSTKVVSGSHDRTIKVWDLQKGYCIRTMFTFASVNDVCLLDFDGSTIASGHLDNNLRFWDARSGNCVKEVTGIHLGQITSVCPSTDGNQVLTNSRDNTLRIIDVRTHETLSVLHADGYKTGTNWSKACFSPDGQYVVSGSADGTLYYWSTRDGTVEKTVREQSSPIVGVSWVNSTVVSAEKDKAVVVWGTTARRPTGYEK